MQTFAELLSQYVERTGISDIELARALGVRRQTVFRWKEGLVDRPRYRDDVLRCADKLRLTPEERDEFLLVAGFAPDKVATIAPEVPPATPVERISIPIKRTLTPWLKRAIARRRLRWVLVVVAILAVVSVIGAAILVNTLGRSSVAVATPGETLVIIGSFDLTAQAGLPTATPNPRFSSDQVSFTTNVSARIQAAVDREMRAARLGTVRVALYPDRIADAQTAEQIRRRTNAAVVVWGAGSGENITVAFASASIPARTNELPLDALVVMPSDLRLKINPASPDEIRSLAFLTLSQVYLNRDDFDLAGAALTQALAQPLRDSDSLNQLYFFSGYVKQISKPPDLRGAIQFYTQAINYSPEMVNAYLNRGLAQLRLDSSPQWQTDLARVLALKLNHLGARQSLCWAYALEKKPDQALPHCDAAVSQDSSARSREARAVVYCELGRYVDAISDLNVFLDWLARQPADLRARYGTSRADWLKTLRAGQNPIDATVLERLRRE